MTGVGLLMYCGAVVNLVAIIVVCLLSQSEAIHIGLLLLIC